MRIIDTALPEVKCVQLPVHHDDRGFFVERFRAEWAEKLGVAGGFIQMNHSRSVPGVLRGLHLQHTPAQGKLVGVTSGAILDVAVDLRPDSPYFMQHVAVELSAENGKLLWVPAGFGHGFCVISKTPADVIYQVTNYYAANGEIGVRYDDAELALRWPVARPVISKRDATLPSLREIKETLTSVNALYKANKAG